MDKVLTDTVVEELLSHRLPKTNKYQKCSFILPDGNFYRMFEHHEAYQYLCYEGLAPCIPDAEQLLSDLGWLRYSWVGYMTLPDKPLTKSQYASLELVLTNIAKTRTEISVQIQSKPRLYFNYSLDDIPNIIRKVKLYYKTGELLP